MQARDWVAQKNKGEQRIAPLLPSACTLPQVLRRIDPTAPSSGGKFRRGAPKRRRLQHGRGNDGSFVANVELTIRVLEVL